MQAVALAVTLLSAALPAPREAVDCARELADARKLYRDDAAERLRFAEPLARTIRQVIDRTLTEEDRVLIRGFRDGAVAADALDRALWPKLRRVFARFNAGDCRHLGGVAGASELVDALTTLRGGPGLHTGVVVTCARQLPGLESRRYLGLRVRSGDDGQTLVLHGVIERSEVAFLAAGEEAPMRRLVIQVPLGDRARESAAFEEAIAAFAGSEADFTWVVPPACQERISRL